jgi:hypothetical protein
MSGGKREVALSRLPKNAAEPMNRIDRNHVNLVVSSIRRASFNDKEE